MEPSNVLPITAAIPSRPVSTDHSIVTDEVMNELRNKVAERSDARRKAYRQVVEDIAEEMFHGNDAFLADLIDPTDIWPIIDYVGDTPFEYDGFRDAVAKGSGLDVMRALFAYCASLIEEDVEAEYQRLQANAAEAYWDWRSEQGGV